jgi:hypothetical protein
VQSEIVEAKRSEIGTVGAAPASAEQGGELGVAVGALGRGGCAVVGGVVDSVAVAVAVVVVAVAVAVAVAAVAVAVVVDIEDQGSWSTNDGSTRA